MTIPLDNLYDYIFSLTGHNNKNLVMYRFSPHGCKNIKNLICHNNVDKIFINLSNNNIELSCHYKLLFCYDQEPLNFSLYENCVDDVRETFNERGLSYYTNNQVFEKITRKKNISGHATVMDTIYDKKLLLHSEMNSEDLKRYEQKGFLGIYYWSHAFVALDWYRFANHDKNIESLPKKNFNKDFNIYCRAWNGTREYRLKFLELLKKNNINVFSNIFFNEYCDNMHYSNYKPEKKMWQFDIHIIESSNNFVYRNTPSSASATYNINDYSESAVDVVLETSFYEEKIQLTEKILRPIACGKPFILVSGKDSLKYLRSYGFKTFGRLIDESYDCIDDPKERLNSIVKTMKSISSLSQQEKNNLFYKMHEIAEYNKNWFFSDKFFNIINQELRKNLLEGLATLDDPNLQKAKELRSIYNYFKKYEEFLPESDKTKIMERITNFPELIKLSKENIKKY